MGNDRWTHGGTELVRHWEVDDGERSRSGRAPNSPWRVSARRLCCTVLPLTMVCNLRACPSMVWKSLVPTCVDKLVTVRSRTDSVLFGHSTTIDLFKINKQ